MCVCQSEAYLIRRTDIVRAAIYSVVIVCSCFRFSFFSVGLVVDWYFFKFEIARDSGRRQSLDECESKAVQPKSQTAKFDSVRRKWSCARHGNKLLINISWRNLSLWCGPHTAATRIQIIIIIYHHFLAAPENDMSLSDSMARHNDSYTTDLITINKLAALFPRIKCNVSKWNPIYSSIRTCWLCVMRTETHSVFIFAANAGFSFSEQAILWMENKWEEEENAERVILLWHRR